MSFEDFCAYHNIVVTYYNFTCKIKGLCIKQDDYYIVAINPKFDYGSQRKTMQHEIMHIMQNHFYCDSSEIEKCEYEINTIIDNYRLCFEEGEIINGI